MEKEKGIRAKRTEQVLRPGQRYSYGSEFLWGLVDSARLLLLKAQADRERREDENFLTVHGPGAIVLTVTAFEAFINAVLRSCLRMSTVNESTLEQLIRNDSLTEKFRLTPKLATGGPELAYEDVVLMQQVRNEVVHWYPRAVGKTGVPEWLQPLADRGLLYTLGAGDKDIGWLDKLLSFQLARWCGQTAASATKQFADALAAGEQDERRLNTAASTARMSARYFRELVI